MNQSLRRTIPVDIWVLIGASFFIAIGFGIVAPVLPTFAASFNVGVAAASAVISIFAFFRLAFAPMSGSLVTRLGERWVYLAGLFIVALSTLATAFATSYAMLMAVRGLGGIGSTMFTVAAMGLIVRLSPEHARGRVSSAYATAFLLGNILGPVVGGLLVGFGLRVPFLVYAGLLFLVWALVWWKLPKPPPRAERLEAVKAPMPVREALAHPAYRAAMATSFAGGWANFGMRIALVPLLVTTVMGAQAWVAGAAMAVFAAGNGIAVVRSGVVSDRRGRRGITMVGLVLAGVTTGLMGIWLTTPGILFLSFMGGFAAGLLGPALQASVADVIGRERSGGKVLAAFQMLSDLGAIIGPIAGGLIAQQFGYGWAFALAGLLLVLPLPLWWRSPETLPGRSATR